MPDENTETVPVNELFDVAAKYINGNPFCEISIKELPSKAVQRHSSSEVKLSLYVSLLGKKHISSSMQVDFVPAFYVQKDDIELTSDSSVAYISVFGVPRQLNSLIVSLLLFACIFMLYSFP